MDFIVMGIDSRDEAGMEEAVGEDLVVATDETGAEPVVDPILVVATDKEVAGLVMVVELVVIVKGVEGVHSPLNNIMLDTPFKISFLFLPLILFLRYCNSSL